MAGLLRGGVFHLEVRNNEEKGEVQQPMVMERGGEGRSHMTGIGRAGRVECMRSELF